MKRAGLHPERSISSADHADDTEKKTSNLEIYFEFFVSSEPALECLIKGQKVLKDSERIFDPQITQINADKV